MVKTHSSASALSSAVAQATILAEYLKSVDEYSLDLDFVQTHAKTLCEFTSAVKHDLAEETVLEIAETHRFHLQPGRVPVLEHIL